MILLVVDTQKGCFDASLYAFDKVRKNITQLITTARENNIEVARTPLPNEYLSDLTEERNGQPLRRHHRNIFKI